MQLVAWSQIERLDPCQQIIATELSPAFQVSIADATIVGIDQAETTLAATATVKGLLHPLHSVIELLNAKVKSEVSVVCMKIFRCKRRAIKMEHIVNSGNENCRIRSYSHGFREPGAEGPFPVFRVDKNFASQPI